MYIIYDCVRIGFIYTNLCLKLRLAEKRKISSKRKLKLKRRGRICEENYTCFS